MIIKNIFRSNTDILVALSPLHDFGRSCECELIDVWFAFGFEVRKIPSWSRGRVGWYVQFVAYCILVVTFACVIQIFKLKYIQQLTGCFAIILWSLLELWKSQSHMNCWISTPFTIVFIWKLIFVMFWSSIARGTYDNHCKFWFIQNRRTRRNIHCLHLAIFNFKDAALHWVRLWGQ